ncbi:MAG: O-antigen ligase family protein [Burkholderiales bacterium]
MEPAGSTFAFGLGLFVLAAPVFRAGNRAWPLLLLELAAIAILVAVALRRRYAEPSPLPRTLTVALVILFGYPLLQLVPLPDALWRALPGRAAYGAIVDHFGAPGGDRLWRPISIEPAATEYGWLALLPPLACLLGVRELAPAHAVRLLVAMAAVVGLEGLLGLLQVGAGRDSIFYLGNAHGYDTATGTFVNRDHYAAMLAMMLPVIVGLLVYDLRHRRAGRQHDPRAGANLLAQRTLLFTCALLALLGLVFTFSRGGIAFALAGLALSAVLLVRAHGRGRHANLIVGALIGAGLVLAAAIGLAPVLEKFEPGELRLAGGGRLALSMATWRAAVEFLPFGSGLSTFAIVFPRFQGGVFGGYVDYAHNDYLQFLLEVGIAAPLVVALLLVAYGRRMRELLRRRDGRSFTLVQIAAGIALVPSLLHSAFDFSLHMPANAMWFAALAGIMLHPGVSPVPHAATR